MKTGWETKLLGNLFQVGSSKRVLQSQWKNEGVPFYRGREITRLSVDGFVDNELFISGEHYLELATKYGVPSEGDIVITAIGTIGNSHIVRLNDKFYFKDASILWLKKTVDVSSEFINFWLKSPLFFNQLDRGNGATVDTLTINKLKGVQLNLPALAEQQRIVAILDEAFEGIATATANTKKNLNNARAVFESTLQSLLMQQGQGWKMERLDALTELARGHNPPKSKFSREPKSGYIRFYQIRDGGTDDYAVYVPDTPQLHKMEKEDIMMVAYRHVGRAFRGVEGAFNVALCKISNVRRDLLDDDYLFHLIPSQFVKGELLKRSERSLIPSMSIEHLKELKIPLPPLHEQQHIVKLMRNLSTETQRLEAIYQQKLMALEELKKSILNQAFSGQLHIKAKAAA